MDHPLRMLFCTLVLWAAGDVAAFDQAPFDVPRNRVLLTLAPAPENPRNSEGAFATLGSVARLRPAEPSLNRDAPAKQLATINVEALVKKENLTGQIYKSVYARLANSYSETQFPKVLPKPDLNEGNHLSYALQWILFALMAFGALFWAIRQEALVRRMRLDPNFVPKVRKKVGDADKAAEDSIL